MPAYVIAGLDVTHPEEYATYARAVTATFEPYAGRFIVRGGALASIEGNWPAERTVVISFPSGTQARAWYDSDAYRAILPIRERHARTHFVVIVEGVE